MQLSELVSEVYVQTNRPDLVEKTSSAIRAATLLAHHSDFYKKDILETGISFDTAAYKQSLDTDVVPRYRKLKWIRKYDNVSELPGDFLTVIDVPEILDDYGIERENIAYEAGQNIQISSNTELQYMLMGVYVSPDVTSLNYNSWVADNFPYLIIHDAAAKVFQSIGNLEQAKAQKVDRNEQFQLFTSSAVALVGE